MIRFSCPACQKKLKFDDRAAGQKISCSMCMHPVVVPLPTAGSDAAHPAARFELGFGTSLFLVGLAVVGLVAVTVAAIISGEGNSGNDAIKQDQKATVRTSTQ